MKDKFKFLLFTTLITSSWSSYVCSQEEKGVSVLINTEAVYDDNIYRVIDELSESDFYFNVSPELKLAGGTGKQFYVLSYIGDYSRFADISEANYSDHDIHGKINFEHTLRFSSKLEARYQKEHEDPGSINRIQLDITEYNKYDLSYIVAGFAYGKESSVGKVELDYTRVNKKYEETELNFLNYSSDELSGTFTYRLAPRTKVYLAAGISELDYDPSIDFELDNTFNIYQIGVSWQFSNKLIGDVNVGYQERDYIQETVRDISGLSYDGNIDWLINTYTTINLNATREALDSSIEGTGGFVRTSYGFRLSHLIKELFEIETMAAYSEDDLIFISSSRQDERYDFSLSFNYRFYRDLEIGTYYSYQERKSSLDLADFKSNVVGIKIIGKWSH